MLEDTKDGLKVFKGRLEDTLIKLHESEYNIALSHVEAMRKTAEENNYYNDLDEDDEEFIDSESWCLTDTLEEAMSLGKKSIAVNSPNLNRIEAFIKSGLKKIEEDLNVLDPCYDDGVDDIDYDIES